MYINKLLCTCVAINSFIINYIKSKLYLNLKRIFLELKGNHIYIKENSFE